MCLPAISECTYEDYSRWEVTATVFSLFLRGEVLGSCVLVGNERFIAWCVTVRSASWAETFAIQLSEVFTVQFQRLFLI